MALLHYIRDNTYCRIGIFEHHHTGVRALRTIPAHRFVFGVRQPANYDFCVFSPEELARAGLPRALVELLYQTLWNERHKTFCIPFYGLNGMPFVFYARRSTTHYNAQCSCDSSSPSLHGVRSTRTILKGEEIIVRPCPHFYYAGGSRTRSCPKIEAIKKKLVLSNLRDATFCRIGKSMIRGYHGCGVIALRPIPRGQNPFSLAFPGFRYDGEECPTKRVLKVVRHPSVLKMMHDFISPGAHSYLLVPKRGLHVLDITFFMNHSPTPNVEPVEHPQFEYVTFRTTQPISEGDELLIDYRCFVPDFERLMGFSVMS